MNTEISIKNMKKTAYDIIQGQDLSGKTFLITGGYAGLGAITTEALLKAGATVIISSHLLAMIQTVCTHLLLMKQGSALFFGRTQELHRKHPEASSLEEAYFAATTSGATGTAVALGLNAIPMDSSIAVGSHA